MLAGEGGAGGISSDIAGEILVGREAASVSVSFLKYEMVTGSGSRKKVIIDKKVISDAV